MTAEHPTVRLTDDLREAAEALSALGHDEIVSSDDPLTVFRNLHTALAALHDAWPALVEAAEFEAAFDRTDIPFIDTIPQALKAAADGLWTAQDSI